MKVLVVGDSPFLTTGFGKVNRVAVKTFQNEGWEVGAVSGLSSDPVADSEGITMFYPGRGDTLGVLRAHEAIQEFEPDLIYHTGEPGTLTDFTRVTPARLPFVAYVPIEGEPIANQDWINVLKGLTVFTCSEYGAKIIERDCGIQNVRWAYHGLDHDVFKVNGRRDEVRKLLNWENKFVIIIVATNVRRKQHTRLFEAVKILKERYHQKDIVVYDHTIPFDGYWLEGWNLPEVSYSLGVHDIVQFNPAMLEHNSSIPEVGLFDNLGLVDLYNAADLFVLPSQVEGFGFPIAEAMACGVPVMVTKYGAGWEIAQPAGIPIPVKDWEIHKSGTRYANADIEALASEILRFRRTGLQEQIRRSKAGLQRVRAFSWTGFQETLITLANQAVIDKKAQNALRSTTEETEDSGENPSRETITSGSSWYEDQAKNSSPSSTSSIESSGTEQNSGQSEAHGDETPSQETR